MKTGNKIAQIYNVKIVDLLSASCMCSENKNNTTDAGRKASIINHLSDKIIELYEIKYSTEKASTRLKKENI